MVKKINSIDPFDNDYFKFAINKLDSIQEIKKDYPKIGGYKIIGELQGGISKLFIALRKENDINKDSLYCVLKKIYCPNSMPSINKYREVLKEISFLCHFRERYIIKIEDSINELDVSQKPTIYVKLPYCAGGSLRTRLLYNPIPTSEALFHLVSILISLDRLHQKDLIHRDVKPENILFLDSTIKDLDNKIIGDDQFNNTFFKKTNEHTWRTILNDFGLAKLSTSSSSLFSGTIWYASPEQLLGKHVSKASDIWAWGLTAWEVLNGSHPYDNLDISQENISPNEVAHTINDYFTSDAWKNEHISSCQWIEDLLKQCLAPQESNRPSTRDILFHLKDKICFELYEAYLGNYDNSYYTYNMNHNTVYLLEILEQHHSWEWQKIKENITFTSIDLSWMIEVKKFSTLVNSNSFLDAITLLKSILGSIKQENSVYSQINNSPYLSSYQLPSASSDQFSKSSPILNKLNISGDKIPRKIVLELIDGYFICLINLIEKENQEKDREDILYLANFCTENRLFDTISNNSDQPNSFLSQANNRLAQAYCLVNKLDYAQKYINIAKNLIENISDFLLFYSTYFHILKAKEKHLENVNWLLNFQRDANIYSQLNESKKVDFYIKLLTSLYYSQAYEDILQLLNIVNQQYLNSDISIMLLLISLFHTRDKKIQETWDSLKYYLFKMTNISYSKLRFIIHCAWIYDERNFALRRTESILLEPQIELPTHYSDKKFFESLVKYQKLPNS